MNEFVGLSKNLMLKKWKKMNWILAIELIALIVSYLVRLIFDKGNFNLSYYLEGLYAFSFIVVFIVGFVILSKNNEHVYTSNNYRLIPVSSTMLYLGNIITTVLAFIYLQILEVILGVAVYIFGGDAQVLKLNLIDDFGTVLQFVLFFLLILILLWIGITVIHFVISWIGDVLPFGHQKFGTFILTVVVTWLALVGFNTTTNSLIKSAYINGLFEINSNAQFSNTLNIIEGIIFLWIVIFTIINIYLLKRWIETNH